MYTCACLRFSGLQKIFRLIFWNFYTTLTMMKMKQLRWKRKRVENGNGSKFYIIKVNFEIIRLSDKWNIPLTFYIKLVSSGSTCSIQNLDFFSLFVSVGMSQNKFIKLTPNISHFIHDLFNARNYFSLHIQVNIFKFLFRT